MKNIMEILRTSAEKAKSTKINAGIILPSYFRDILDKQLNKINNAVPQFTKSCRNRWDFFKSSATVYEFHRLMTSKNPSVNAIIMTRCSRPILSKEILLQFLATQLGTTPDAIDTSARVDTLKLLVSNNSAWSWITLIGWCQEFYHGHPAEDVIASMDIDCDALSSKELVELDKLGELSIDELFDIWINNR